MFIALCDDVEIDRKIVINLLGEYFHKNSIDYSICEYSRGSDLVYDIEDGKEYELIFLDIYIYDELGIDIAKKLRKINFKGEIVFITSTPDFAVDSYDVDAKGYLLKPHSYDKISKMMDKITKNTVIKTYNIHNRNGIVRIPYNEILFVESNNSKCIIHRQGGDNYVIYKRLNVIEKELNDNRFLRCHQSYLVNMNHIQKADKEFQLSNGETISIRQRNQKAIRQVYLDYIYDNA